MRPRWGPLGGLPGGGMCFVVDLSTAGGGLVWGEGWVMFQAFLLFFLFLPYSTD